MILRCLVLSPRLHAVVAMTQSLPVAPIPEELLVTTMRNDMVDVRRLNIPAFLHALHTQWVRLKVTLAGSVPCGAVASAACGARVLWVEGTVLVAVLGAVGNGRSTAGVSAWGIRSLGHWLHLHERLM